MINLVINSKINTTLIILSIFIVLFCTYKLQNNSTKIKRENIIGEISTYELDVRIKPKEQFKWFQLEHEKNYLSFNDRIFSNKSSSALIKLKSGGEILLSEQSLIRIQDKDTIEINDGEATIKFKNNRSRVNIKLGDKTYLIKAREPGSISIKKRKKTTLRVDKGEITISDKNNSISLKKNNTLELEEKNNLDKKFKFTPNNEVILIRKNKKEISFNIPKNKNEIIIADNPVFKNSKKYQKSKIVLGAGDYFWKVNGYKSSSFKIKQLILPPVFLNLRKDKILKFITFKTSYDLKLNFNSSAYQKTLRLIKKDGTERFYSLGKKDFFRDSIKVGTYQIQAKIKDQLYESNWSQPYRFEIIKQNLKDLKSIVIEIAKPNQDVNFKWTNTKKVNLSVFELAKDPNFTDIIVTKIIRNNNQTKVNFPVVGKFYWRSQAKDETGNLTPNTPVEITIKPTPPPKKPLNPPDIKLKIKKRKNKRSFLFKIINFIFPSAYADTENLITFPPIENAKEYNIQIFKHNDLSTPIKIIKTSKNSFAWSPPSDGLFKWRLRYMDFWGRYSDYSNFSEIKVDMVYIKSRKLKSTKNNKSKKKLKKEISKKNSLVAKKKIDLLSKNHIRLGIGPASFIHNQSRDNNFNIKGVVFDHKEFEIEKSINSNYLNSHNFRYTSTGGKVFSGENFYRRSIDYSLNTKFYALRALLSFHQISKLTLSDNQEVRSKNNLRELKWGLGHSLPLFNGKAYEISSLLELLLNSDISYRFTLSYQYHWKNDYKLDCAIRSFVFNENIDEIQLKSQTNQMVIGINKLF